jgi:hypothetical protein
MKKHIALGLVASTLFLAGCCTSHHASAWEYKKVYSLDQLNKAAADGWVVASYSAYTGVEVSPNAPIPYQFRDSEVYLLKRQKQ